MSGTNFLVFYKIKWIVILPIGYDILNIVEFGSWFLIE